MGFGSDICKISFYVLQNQEGYISRHFRYFYNQTNLSVPSFIYSFNNYWTPSCGKQSARVWNKVVNKTQSLTQSDWSVRQPSEHFKYCASICDKWECEWSIKEGDT